MSAGEAISGEQMSSASKTAYVPVRSCFKQPWRISLHAMRLVSFSHPLTERLHTLHFAKCICFGCVLIRRSLKVTKLRWVWGRINQKHPHIRLAEFSKASEITCATVPMNDYIALHNGSKLSFWALAQKLINVCSSRDSGLIGLRLLSVEGVAMW